MKFERTMDNQNQNQNQPQPLATKIAEEEAKLQYAHAQKAIAGDDLIKTSFAIGANPDEEGIAQLQAAE